MDKGESLAKQMVEAVRASIAKSVMPLLQRIDELEIKLKALPTVEKGDRGEPGRDGKDGAGDKGDKGEAGLQGVAGERGDKGDAGNDGKDADPAAIVAEVAKAVSYIPAAKDGKDGKDGASVHPDTVALMVREAADKVAAAMPRPKDGADGFSLEDFDVALSDDGRTLTLKFQRGEVKRERAIKLETMIYREVWREGEYERGDVVTWGGSAWHCQQKTTDKPGASAAWKMMVKEGRAGKDGAAPTAAVVREPVRLR